MASLGLGIVGAVVGGVIGGPIGASIGWGIGSYVGATLDPQKVYGPRLTDLKVQSSSYGVMIPIVYGTIRIAGQVIFATDLVEHTQTSGGKGGSTVETTTYTYSCSFAIYLCEGEVADVTRVWADNRLIYDTRPGGSGGSLAFTLYPGDETQLPDPRMETELGAGNVPAYRGVAYLMFEDLDLAEFGNRIPNFTFEVVKKGTPLGPISRIEQNYTDGQTFYVAGGGERHIPAITEWPMSGGDVRVREVTLAGNNASVTFLGEQWLFDRATLTVSGTDTTLDEFPAWFNLHNDYSHCTHRSWVIYPLGQYRYADGSSFPLWFDPQSPVGNTTQSPAVYYSVVSLPDDSCGPPEGGNFLYNAGVPSGRYLIGASLTQDGRSLFAFTGHSEGWTGLPETMTEWYEIREGIVVRQGTVTPALGIYDLGFGNSAQFHFGCCQFENNRKFCWQYYGASGGTFGGGYTGGRVRLFQIDASGNFALIPFTGTAPYDLELGGPAGMGEPAGDAPGENWGSIQVIREGTAGVISYDQMAVFTRSAGTADTLLSEIVADLSHRAGLTDGDIDVSELTDIVKGYAISTQADVRADIEPLRVAYSFDGVESDDIIKFPKRLETATIVIPDDDLAASSDGNPPPVLTFKRAKEVDLPRRLNINYLDYDADYQNGTQIAQRMVTLSDSEQTISLAIVLSVDEAKSIADLNLYRAWLERDSFQFSVPRKYTDLEPTDVRIVNGRSLRITGKTERGGLIDFDGVQTIGAAFVHHARGVAGLARGGQGAGGEGVTPAQTSQLEMLDIAYIADPARQNVYWAAMAGAQRSSWKGATLYQSNDSVNYNSVGTSVNPDTIGFASTVLSSFVGGNVFDEANRVQVTIGPGGGELSSTTDEGVLNGGNLFLLGGEILQARDATLISGSTYELGGFLRGRNGTEWAMTTHTIGERFIVLPAHDELPFLTSDVGMNRQYKAVTLGNAISSAEAHPFTLRGVSVTPYSPVHPFAGTNADGDWILQWTRRARVNYAWLNYTDVPLGESLETYLVTLWTDNTYLTVASHIQHFGDTTVTVTAAAQTTIFGSPQSELFWSVAQIGILGPGYDTLGRAPTVATPPPSPPPPSPTPPVLVPPPPAGEQWHEDFVFTGGTHAELNANWLMAQYGSSWCWAYVTCSYGNLNNLLLIADPGGDGLAILQAFSQGIRGPAPAGVLIPWFPYVTAGPALHSNWPYTNIPLPYADDDLT